MIAKVIKITFKYGYVDNPDGRYTGIIYHKKNDYINYGNKTDLNKVIEAYIDEYDKSMILKLIVDVETMGGNFFG